MALHLHLFSPSTRPSTIPTAAVAAAATPLSRLMRKSVNLQSRSFEALQFCKHVGVHKRETLIVWASADIDGADSSAANPPEEAKAEESKSVEKLPLESKQQLLEAKAQLLEAKAQLLEANKLRMKLAKKVRLRRKRLVRKRRLRKKGRWPPSKMKKNKNV